MMPHHLRRLVLPACTVLILLATAAAPAAAASAPPSRAANPHAAAAASAARWLSGQLVDGGMPGFAGVDWGLTIDVLVALEATGADPAAARAVTDAIAAHVDDYATGGQWAPDLRIAGATAKILYAATVAGRDPTDFGGHDLRRRTLDLVAGPDTGARHGWLTSRNATGPTTGGNMFDQSLAVLGLARSGGVAAPVVSFLIGQQCPAGGFRLSPPADGAPCAATAPQAQVMDPDTTGIAVQALLAAGTPAASAAAERGVAWLLSIQQPDGAFHGSAVTDFSNANSTGLAGQALAAAGRARTGDRAATWVAARQLTTSNAGASARHAGAIAYTPAVFATAVASGITDGELDQWRRSTAQAMLALAKVSLGEIGLVEPDPVPPGTPGPPPSSHPPSPPGSSGPPPGSSGPPPAASLPITGLPLSGMPFAGGLAVLVGAGLVVVARRRRDRTP